MKIVITGGAGFIGSHLAEFLIKKKHQIVIIDNLSTGRIENIKSFKKKVKFVNADISKKGRWMQNFKNTQVVFHFAALADIVPSIKDPHTYFQSNVVGTENVANSCVINNVKKIIYAASSSCYGIPKNYPTSEKESIKPQYPYALTKNIGEQILIHYGKIYGFQVTSMRLFNVYGTRSRTSGTYGAVLGVFLKQKLSNKPFTVVGNGNQTRDFIFVSDVVSAIMCSINSKIKGEIFNIGSGKTYSINHLVKLIGGKKIYIPKRPGEPDCTHSNISKAKKLLLWKPKITLKNGIKTILNNIEYWKNAPLWNKNSINNATKDWFKYLK